MPTIDQRIVEMKFDNAQFEKGVTQSLKTLDALKKGLDLDKVSDSLVNVEHKISQLDFSGIANGINQIKWHFTALGRWVDRHIDSMVHSIESKFSVINPLSGANLSGGMGKYETQTKAVQTITNATGKSVAEVEEVLGKLMKYTDETSYDFVEMASSIGKFTSVGVELEKAERAMEGIANEAALSGAGKAEANRAMYNFAQALSAGSVKLIDWKSIENANMATKEFKEELIKTAIEMGTIKKKGDAVGAVMKQTSKATKKSAAQFKETEVNYKTFNQTLSEGWLTSDVLINTLERYADKDGPVGSLGRRAYEAAQKALTLTDAIDAIADAITSSWMTSFKYMFGDLNEAMDLWTNFCNAIIAVEDEFSSYRNELLKGWHEQGGYNAMIEAASNIWDTFCNILHMVKDAFAQVFPPATAENIVAVTEKIRDVTASWKQLLGYNEVQEVEEEVMRTVDYAEEFEEAIKKGMNNDYVKLFQKTLMDAGYSLDRFGADGIYGPETRAAIMEMQKDLGVKQTGEWDEATRKAAIAAGIFKMTEKGVESVKKELGETYTVMEDYDRIIHYADKMRVGMKRGDQGDDIKMLQEQLIRLGYLDEGQADAIFGPKTEKALKKFQEAIGEEQTGVWDRHTRETARLKGVMDVTETATRKVTKTVGAQTSTMQRLQDTVRGAASAFHILTSFIGFVGDALKYAGTLLTPVIDGFLTAASVIGNLFTNLDNSINSSGLFGSWLESIKISLTPLKDFLKKIGEGINTFFENNKGVKTFTELWEALRIELSKNETWKYVLDVLIGFKDKLFKIGKSIKSLYKTAKKWLGDKFTALFDWIGSGKLKKAYEDFLTSVATKFEELKTKYPIIKMISDAFSDAVKSIKAFIDRLKGYYQLLFGKGQFDKKNWLLLTQSWVKKAQESIEGFVNGVKQRWKDLKEKYPLLQSIENAFKELPGKISKFAADAWTTINSFFVDGKFDKDTFLDALKNKFEEVKTKFEEFRDGLYNWFDMLKQKYPILGSVANVFSVIASNFVTLAEAIRKSVSNLFGTSFSNIGENGKQLGFFEMFKQRLEALRPILDWFIGIKDRVLSFFGLNALGEEGEILTWFDGLKNAHPILSTIIDSLSIFIDKLKELPGIIKDVAVRFFSTDASTSGSFLDNLMKRLEAFQPLVDWIKSIFESITEAWNDGKGTLSSVAGVTSNGGLLDQIFENLGKLMAKVQGFNIKKLMKPAMAALGVFIALTVAKAISRIGKSFQIVGAGFSGLTEAIGSSISNFIGNDSIGSIIGNVVNSLSESIKKRPKDSIGTAFLKIAGSLAIVAASVSAILAVLAYIPMDEARKNLDVFGIVIGSLAGVLIVIGAVAKISGENIKSAGIGIAAIAISLGLIIGAIWGAIQLFKKNHENPEYLYSALKLIGGIILALTVIVGAMLLASGFSGKATAVDGIWQMCLGLALVVFSISRLTKLITKYSDDQKPVFQAFAAIEVMLVTLGAIAVLISGNSYHGKNKISGILGMCVGVGLLVLAIWGVTELIKNNGKQTWAALGMIETLLITMGGISITIAALSKTGKAKLGGVFSMCAGLTVLLIMVGRITDLIGNHGEQAWAAFGMIETLLVTIGVISILLSSIAKGGGSWKGTGLQILTIAAIVFSLCLVAEAFAKAIDKIKGVDPLLVVGFIGGVIVGVAAFAGIASLLGHVDFGVLLTGCLGIVVVATTLGLAVGILVKIGSNALNEFGSAIWVLGSKLKNFTEIIKQVKFELIRPFVTAIELLAVLLALILTQKITENKITDFTSALQSLGSSVDLFWGHVSNFVKHASSFTERGAFETAVKSLGALLSSSELTSVKEDSTSGFRSELKRLGASLFLFHALTTDIPETSSTALTTLVDDSIALLNKINTNLTDTAIESASSGLTNLGGALKLYYDNLKEIDFESGGATPEQISAAFTGLSDGLPDDSTIGDLAKYGKQGENSNDLLDFAVGITSLGTAIKEYGTAIGTLDSDAVTKANSVLEAVGGLTTSLSQATFFDLGNNLVSVQKGITLSDFTDDLTALGKALGAYGTDIGTLKTNDVRNANRVLTTVAGLTKTLNEDASFWDFMKFASTKKITIQKFSTDINTLGDALRNYGTSIGTLEETQVKTATSVLSFLSTMDVPTSGGLLSLVLGESSLGTFASNLGSLGDGIAQFAGHISGSEIDKVNMYKALKPISVLAEAQGMLNKTGGVASLFTGEASLSTLGAQLKEFGGQLNEFANEVKSFNPNDITNAMTALTEIVGLQTQLNVGSLTIFGDLAEQLSTFFYRLSGVWNDPENTVVSDTLEVVGVLNTAWETIFDLAEIFEKKKTELTNFIMSLAGAGLQKIYSYQQYFRYAGMSIINGLIYGMNDNLERFKEASANVAMNGYEAFCKVLGIESPSKEYAKASKFSILGLVDGMEENEKLFADANKDLGKEGLSALFDGYSTDDLMDSVESMVTDLGSTISDGMPDMSGYLNSMKDSVSELITKVPDMGGELMSKIGESFDLESVLGDPKEYVKGMISQFGDKFDLNNIGIDPEGFVNELMGSFGNLSTDKFDAVKEYLTKGFSNLTKDGLPGAEEILKDVDSLLNSDDDYEFTVTPVVDDRQVELFEKTLKKGMVSDDVKQMQKMLMSNGYNLDKYGADGIYGPETKAAVKQLQRDLMVAQTGVWDEATRKAAAASDSIKAAANASSTLPFNQSRNLYTNIGEQSTNMSLSIAEAQNAMTALMTTSKTLEYIAKRYNEESEKFHKENSLISTKIDTVSRTVGNMKLVMDTGAVVGQIAPAMDKALGRRAVAGERGRL